MERDSVNPMSLTLSLGGIFRQEAAVPPAEEVAEAAAGSLGRRVDSGKRKEVVGGQSGQRRETVLEIGRVRSTARTLSEEEYEGEEIDGGAGRKRKRYHRHTADQIKELELLYRHSRLPNELQRQELGNRLGLSPQQVKFWFQNRRTQTKAMNERNENSSMRNEMEMVKEENNFLREVLKKTLCLNCGFPTMDAQDLRIKNALLLAEFEKLKAVVNVSGSSPASGTSCVLGIEVSKIMKLVGQATEELIDMESLKEPLWSRGMENGSGIINNNEYVRRFRSGDSTNESRGMRIEVSREIVTVFADIIELVQCFMNVNEWKDMFPSIISKATSVDVISEGKGNHRNGDVQLMFAEYQMLTPTVPIREVHFVRHCRQLSFKKWVIVDFSVANSIEVSAVKFRKRPSGCIIENILEGHCKVTWIEHFECENISIPTNYPRIISTAFGARHWATALQQQCERRSYMMTTHFPTYESNVYGNRIGPASAMEERKSIMMLANKMTINFCRSIGSSLHKSTKLTSKKEYDIRVSIRKNLNEPGEPIGVILCAVTSIWLPVTRLVLFDYLSDESRRHEWDVILNGKPAESIINMTMGSNSVTIQGIKGKEDDMRIMQDSSTNEFESMLVFASLSMSSLQSNSARGNSGEIVMLPSGFSILQEGLESRPMVFDGSMDQEHMLKSKGAEEGGRQGCLLTLAFQILANNSPMEELSYKISARRGGCAVGEWQSSNYKVRENGDDEVDGTNKTKTRFQRHFPNQDREMEMYGNLSETSLNLNF
ncbi:homeobox-leucine zipper protein GLABRA 2-like [Impatiens glandulifera]|uniref:homeobox-leucine zipper protein GLABRA 2-like n=1 Tax=Impatiens glandulifera TaxID=253017 RepID=UPI001FB0A0ED|nr:homeobox-leucine zipper protein GLABRA 2-like [Impatiens glandulifera]